MKISYDRSLLSMEAYVKNAQNSEDLRPSPKQGSEKSLQIERVKLSTVARELQKAREILEATPEIREEKVGRFRQEIGAGVYEVRGDKVAEKMFKEFLINTFV